MTRYICNSKRTIFAAHLAHPQPRLTFYYGGTDKLCSLDDYDVAIIESGHGFCPALTPQSTTQWLGYISIGEVLTTTSYFDQLPREWLIHRNSTWGGLIFDQTAAGWPEFLIQHIANPIWQAGYQGFFLDTVDSYLQLNNPEQHMQQGDGLLRTILHLRQTFPDAIIIINRGFELLPALHFCIDAVAFESLYRGWNEQQKRYTTISEQDRHWLLIQTATAHSYDLPVISIDYCAPQHCAQVPAIMTQIAAHGIVPCVSDNYFQTIYPFPDHGSQTISSAHRKYYS